MADVNADINIDINTSQALAQLKSLQRQISQFHTSIVRSSEAASLAQRNLQKNFINSVNAIGAFSAELRSIRTTAESFTDSLEKNKFGMREYFRYSAGATRTFGRFFRSEFETINKVAEENVKRLQTQYIKMGRDANGVMQAIAIIPKQLDLSDYTTQTQLAAQRQALFNQLVKQGTTNLLNFGKNTQWAGRQLMVGFTLPLMALGTTAARTFMEMEAAALKFRKVYGDLFTPTEERAQALQDVTELGKVFAQYGIAVSETVNLAADAAAAGFQGVDLQRQVTEATRLQVLGQIDQQKALETTISLQNAFKLSNEDLSESINFLNAVENQTVVSLDDVTTAIPKVAPVIQQLGGNVKDLAFFLTAMKQGGINASEGANALKSGLAALINPTGKAAEMLSSMGINIKQIVESNQGNLKATVVEFAKALDTLDPLTRARAIEQLFGKFQFARLSTLFENVTKDGTQAARVMELAGYSASELASMAESELGMTAESSMNKFRKAVETLRLELVPVGETFLQAVTPIVDFIGNILEKFNGLSSGTKKAITVLTVAIGAIGPVVLMTFGLLANALANILKGANILRNGYLRLTGQSNLLAAQTDYLTIEQQNAAAVAHSLDQTHAQLTQTFNVEAAAVDKLAAAYRSAIAAGARFAANNPNMMMPPRKFNKGVVVVPGTGNKDTVPAMLTPGEAVIPSEMAKKYAPLIQGMIAGNIPGYKIGRKGSAAGSFSKTASEIKAMDKVALYKAPSAIKGQTSKISWGTLEAELQALDDAARSYLEELGFSAEDITRKLNALKRKQASHIREQILEIEVAGEVVDAKLWNADNLIVDLGAINNYLNSIHKVSQSLSQTDIAEMASKLNMSIDEFEAELQKLQEGIHPTTRAGAGVLGEVAKRGINSEDVTLAYQSRAAAAVMDTRLASDFYETTAQRAYDPSKDLRALEQVEQRILNFRSEIVNAFNIGPEIAQMAGTTVESLQSAWNQLSVEARSRLLELKDNATLFTQGLLQEAQAAEIAGFELGDSAIRGIAQGTQSASNSKRAIEEGHNVEGGFEQGILEGMDDASLAGERVGDAAVQGLAKAKTKARAAGQSTTAEDISNNMPVSGPVLKSGQDILNAQKVQVDRLTQLNGRLMAASFAVSGLSSAAAIFSEGPLKEFSGIIAKVSTAMFALMSITQALTQTQIVRLAQERLATAGFLTKTAAGTFTKTTGLFAGGISKLLPNLGRLVLMFGRFIGPVGIAISVLGLFKLTIDKLNKAKENERLKTNALSETLSRSDKLIRGKLAEEFGFVPRKSRLELFKPAKDLEAVTGTERQAREDFREKFKDDEEFKAVVQATKNLTKDQQKTALEIAGIQAMAAGATAPQAQLYIDTLKEEIGRADLTFDFNSLKFNEEDITRLSNDVAATLEGTATKYKDVADRLAADMLPEMTKAYQDAVESGNTEAAKRFKIVLDNINKELENARVDWTDQGAALGEYINSIQLLFESGKINAKGFNSAFVQIGQTVKKVGGKDAMGLLKATIKSINPELATVLKGINNWEAGLLLVKASAAGVTNEVIRGAKAAIIAGEAAAKTYAQMLTLSKTQGKTPSDFGPQMAAADTAMVNQQKAYDDLTKKINELLKKTEEQNSSTKKSGDQNVSIIGKQVTELQNQIDAYKQLRSAGVDAATAIELAGNAELATILKTKAGVQSLLGQIKQYAKLRKEMAMLEEAGMDIGDATIADLNRKKSFIELQEQLLTMKYSHELERQNIALRDQEWALEQISRKIAKIENDQIAPIQKIIEENNFALENIALVEDEINEKYDKQQEVLSKVLEINEDIAKVQKARISIADALTRGDISAAAQAVQDLRSQQANISVSNQQKTLDMARKQELAALRRKEIEKENKKLQLEITTIQFEQIRKYEQQKTAIQSNIDGIQDVIANIDYATAVSIQNMNDKLKETFGGTKTEIENALKALDLSKAAGIDINDPNLLQNILKAAGGDAKSLSELLTDLPTKFAKVLADIKALRDAMNLANVPTIPNVPIQNQNRDPGTGDGTKDGTGDGTKDGTGDGTKDGNGASAGDGSNYGIGSSKDAKDGADGLASSGASTAVAPKPSTPSYSTYVVKPGDTLSKIAKKNGVTLNEILDANPKFETNPKYKNGNMIWSGTTVKIPEEPRSGGGGGGFGSAMMLAKGGFINPKYMSIGGMARGTDKIPAMLSPGEFIMSKYAVQNYGVDKLKAINSGENGYDSVYNYSVNVNVKTDSDASQIAKAVMDQIKYIDSQRVKGQRAR